MEIKKGTKIYTAEAKEYTVTCVRQGTIHAVREDELRYTRKIKAEFKGTRLINKKDRHPLFLERSKVEEYAEAKRLTSEVQRYFGFGLSDALYQLLKVEDLSTAKELHGLMSRIRDILEGKGGESETRNLLYRAKRLLEMYGRGEGKGPDFIGETLSVQSHITRILMSYKV